MNFLDLMPNKKRRNGKSESDNWKLIQDHAPRSYPQQKSRYKNPDIYVKIPIIFWFSTIRRPSKTHNFPKTVKYSDWTTGNVSIIPYDIESTLCHDSYHYRLIYTIFEKVDDVINTIDFVIVPTCLLFFITRYRQILILPLQYYNALVFV
ncbi:hypothetical protein PEB0122_010240 [Bartonella apis]|nr:hypothetical protein PEB0122_010240 [Bartonella apis]